MFRRTQFFVSKVRTCEKLAKITYFWPTILKQRQKNNPKTALYLISSSSTINPMENTAMFRQTQFFRFKGGPVKNWQNRTFLADYFKVKGGK